MLKLKVGDPTKAPYYSVIGSSKVKFYVWVYEEGEHGTASKWLLGDMDTYNELERLHKKDKKGFIALVKQLHKEHS